MWKRISDKVRIWCGSLSDFLFPRYCTCCAGRLALGEEFICSNCLTLMPFTHHKSFIDNPMAERFRGLVPVQKATSYFLYVKSSPYAQILFDLKYRNRPEIGFFMGRNMARSLIRTDFFNDIDIIIPVPLSRQKERQRGYNQSLWIARGIADITGIPIDEKSVLRIISNPSQTTLSHTERLTNVANIFRLEHPDKMAGRHILLVDDVITTGATLLSCAEAITRQQDNVRISMLTLAQSSAL